MGISSPITSNDSGDSFFSRLVGVFISPRQAFESIVRKPDFIAPLIVAIVGTIILTEAMLRKIGAEQIIRRSLELSGKAAQMSPEQVEAAVHRAGGITAILMRVGAIMGVPLFLLIVAALGLFIANAIFGGAVDFKTSFSVTCYANLVLQTAIILGLVIVFMGDPEQFNPENPVPTTLGFFLNPREIPKFLNSLASSFDLFRIWFIFLCAMGLSLATVKAAAPRRNASFGASASSTPDLGEVMESHPAQKLAGKYVKTTSIFAVYMGIWILFALAKAAIAALM